MLSVSDLLFLHFGPFALDIAAGECLGLTGPSGAGKSRMLRSLADLDPHEGHVLLDGVEASAMPAPEWRRQVGLLPAESHWWSERVGDHFAEAGEEVWLQDGLADLDLSHEVMDWDIRRLSTGEKQRLALLRLLGNKPRILLLDEPTAGLDAVNVRRVEELATRYREDHRGAVLWVSHDTDQLRRVTSRILRLADGRLEPLA